MTQGNPFGRGSAWWMTETKLRALFNAGLTYDEIAEINERSEGWKPSRAAVKNKREELGLPARRASHSDLLPWRIASEHNNHLLRHMLQAESRARKGGELSGTDRKLTERLHELLFGRGTLMVVGYHPAVGFYLATRSETDEDIIRHRGRADFSDPVEQAIWDVAEISENERLTLIGLIRRQRSATSAARDIAVG